MPASLARAMARSSKSSTPSSRCSSTPTHSQPPWTPQSSPSSSSWRCVRARCCASVAVAVAALTGIALMSHTHTHTPSLQWSPYPYLNGTHFQANFGHLVGYSSNYYTYQWSLAIAYVSVPPQAHTQRYVPHSKVCWGRHCRTCLVPSRQRGCTTLKWTTSTRHR